MVFWDTGYVKLHPPPETVTGLRATTTCDRIAGYIAPGSRFTAPAVHLLFRFRVYAELLVFAVSAGCNDVVLITLPRDRLQESQSAMDNKIASQDRIILNRQCWIFRGFYSQVRLSRSHCLKHNPLAVWTGLGAMPARARGSARKYNPTMELKRREFRVSGHGQSLWRPCRAQERWPGSA